MAYGPSSSGECASGLITRTRDAEDHRVVRLRLTAAGERVLSALSAAHLEEVVTG